MKWLTVSQIKCFTQGQANFDREYIINGDRVGECY